MAEEGGQEDARIEEIQGIVQDEVAKAIEANLPRLME